MISVDHSLNVAFNYWIHNQKLWNSHLCFLKDEAYRFCFLVKSLHP